MIEINHRFLNTDILDLLLTEIIGHDSTDYRDGEIALTDKKQQLHQQLEEGRVMIVFSRKDNFCKIIPKIDD